MDLKELIVSLNELQGRLEKAITRRYFNSQPVATAHVRSKKHSMKIPFRLHDFMLVGALTQSPVLLSGSSGSGKTYLAELILEFLFSKNGYVRKNITPDMNEQDFMDIDFGAIKAGKTLKEALMADKLFGCPALIIDEANRAPPIIQNRLLQILENNIDLKSKSIKAGQQLENGSFYQWIILTLNIGAEYAGTSAVDRALKDRITIDIPIDQFPPLLEDQIRMIRAGQSPPLEVPDAEVEKNSKLIFEAYQLIDSIPLSLEAEAFLLYLSFCSNCIKSPTGSKYGIVFSPNFCKENDCQYARNPPLNKFCPYMYAPSNRVLRRVVLLAKGFFLLKHAKALDKLPRGDEAQVEEFLKEVIQQEVSDSDVAAVAPFVLHSKVPLNRDRVLNHYNGNTFIAVQEILKIIKQRLNEFMMNLLNGLVNEKRGGEITQKDKTLRKRLKEEDFHFDGLIRFVKEYLVA